LHTVGLINCALSAESCAKEGGTKGPRRLWVRKSMGCGDARGL
jgi:hypothetical protein